MPGLTETAPSTPQPDAWPRGPRFRCAYSHATCTPASACSTGLRREPGMLRMVACRAQPVENPALAGPATTPPPSQMPLSPQRTALATPGPADESAARNPRIRSDYAVVLVRGLPSQPGCHGIGWNDYTARPYALPEELHPTRWTATRPYASRGRQRAEPFFLKVFLRPPHDPTIRRSALAPLCPRPTAARPRGAWGAKYASRSWERDDIWHGDMGPAAVRRRAGLLRLGNVCRRADRRILESWEARGLLDQPSSSSPPTTAI